MIASMPAGGPTEEVWCAQCQAPAIGTWRDQAYCAEHDPRRVQVLMPVAQAARLAAWLEGPRATSNDDAADLYSALVGALAAATKEAPR